MLWNWKWEFPKARRPYRTPIFVGNSQVVQKPLCASAPHLAEQNACRRIAAACLGTEDTFTWVAFQHSPGFATLGV